jgi:hypothetical protein
VRPSPWDGRYHVRRAIRQVDAHVPADLGVRGCALALEGDARGHDEFALHVVVRVMHLAVGEPGVLDGRADAVLLELVALAYGAGALHGGDGLVGGELADGFG